MKKQGLTLNSYTYKGIVTFVSDKWGTEYMHLFLSDDFSGSLKECDEGELMWVKKKKFALFTAGKVTKYF